MRKRLLKLFLIIFFLPYLLAFILTLIYSVIPPVSIPLIETTFSNKEVHWRWRSINNISPSLPRMIITAEDGRFCQHNGVDWVAMRKTAYAAGTKLKVSGGASTIAMQTAKNLFLWPLPGIIRKPLEIPLAMWINLIWSKQRIIEVYMNIAEFGFGVYGAEAASHFYFNKPASKLTPGESAALASILPAPEKRDPEHPSRAVASYAASIRQRSAKAIVKCIK